MKRRSFIRTTSLASSALLARPCLPPELFSRQNESHFLLDKLRNEMLFPRPANGAKFSISPVGMTWLPCLDAEAYIVHIKDSSGRLIYEKQINKDPVHLPDEVLEPGLYRWNILALDGAGKTIAIKGEQEFFINKDALALPWIDVHELLSRVPGEHSKLMFPRWELDKVRATLNSTRKRSWNACKAAADKALNMPAPVYPKHQHILDSGTMDLEYNRYFRYFRKFVDEALMDLSLAFLMTEEYKYAESAKRILLEIASWPIDDENVTSVSGKWKDEPGLSFAKCGHKAYDWLYHALDENEKELVRKMCEDRAWQVFRRLHNKKYLTYPGNSHEGRLIAYQTDMALVLSSESAGAATWLEYSLKALMTFYPHWAGIDGGWAEGTPYGLWYNTYYIPAFTGLKQLADLDLWKRPFFNNVRYFFFYCTAIRGEMRPFGDSALKGGPGVQKGSGYADLMWFHAHQFKDPNIGWWVSQIEGWDGSKGERSLLFEDHPPIEKPVDLPASRVFNSVGWAGLHSDITDPDNDTCMIFKSSPYGSVSHSHADQNAFAIMKGGAALAIPSGHYGPTWGKPHHFKWTQSTKANNCILVNGEGQPTSSAKAKGKIMDFKDTVGISYVAGDATAAYMGKLIRCHRHILFIRPGIFIMLDDLIAPAPSQFQWMIHALEEMELNTNQIISRRKGAQLQIWLRSQEDFTLSQTDQFDTPYNAGIPEEYREEADNHWHVKAEFPKKRSDLRIAAIMNVLGPHDKVGVKLLDHPGWLGIRSSYPSGSTEGWVQLEEGSPGPAGYGPSVSGGIAKMCCKDLSNEQFVL